MIKFDLPLNRTFSSFLQISFTTAQDLRNVELSLGDHSFIMLALKGGMMKEELNQLMDSLDQSLKEKELHFEMFDSLKYHILYIFN